MPARIPHFPVSSAVEAQAEALRLLTRPPPGVEVMAGMTAAHHAIVQPYLRRVLALAPAYYWSPPLGRLLEAMAPDLPSDWRLQPEALLTPTGWAWFDPPLTLPIAGRTPLALAAVLWGPPVQRRQVGRDTDAPTGFALWFGSPHGGPPLPWLLLDWRCGETLAALTAFAVQDYTDAEDRPALEAALRLLAASLALASQQLLAAPATPLERHAHKRLVAGQVLPLAPEPTVRVVQLRRQTGPTVPRAASAPEHVDWQWQWLVRGHWRQQPYPSRGVVQPIWIHAYTKGPADRPVKPPRPTLFAVVR